MCVHKEVHREVADLEFWKGRVRIPDSRKGQLKKYIIL